MPLFIASPASFFISVLPLPASPIGFLRLTSVMRSLFSLLSPWRLLLLTLLLLLLPLIILLLLMLLLTLLSLIILPWTSRRRRFLPSPLSRRGRSMFYLLLKVLADCAVTRLVTVTLAAQPMLLLHLGISVS